MDTVSHNHPNMTKTTGGGQRPLSVWMGVVLIAILAAAFYLLGAGLARRMLPTVSHPLPAVIPPTFPTATPTGDRITPGEPVEGSLGGSSGTGEETGYNVWYFPAQAGQSATVEMWLHPGSGSNVEAELVARLLSANGVLLSEETGSVFLPPYLSVPSLPADGFYRIEVRPAIGEPGRYSLLVTLSDQETAVTPETSRPHLSPPTPIGQLVTPAEGMFQWPTIRRRISGWVFHDPGNPGHIGLDIAAEMWDPITAAADGVVLFAEWGGGYGNLVIVEHPGGWRTYYAHLSEIVVTVGQTVRQGELLGGAGTTGYSTGTHLHFEIRYQGRPVDPQLYLP